MKKRFQSEIQTYRGSNRKDDMSRNSNRKYDMRCRKERWFVLYDGRAQFGDTEVASVCSASSSIEDVRDDRDNFFPDGVIFSYLQGPDDRLIDERFEE